MIVGIPKETKNHEYRVGATPTLVQSLVTHGHVVLVETQAGEAIGFSDELYRSAGASIVSQKDVWDADLIVKVKEPQEGEFQFMKEGQVLFCFFHLAPDPEQVKSLREKKVIAIAYETILDKDGKIPPLIPMSEIAGRLSIQVGANLLQLNQGGKGLLLGGVPGTRKGRVLIIGGGISGLEAARVAMGLGAEVKIVDHNIERLRQLDLRFGPYLQTLYASQRTLEEHVPRADLLVGTVHVRGKATPKILSRDLISKMEKGSVFVDISIDQGGCSETSRSTTHDDPTYLEEGVIHYCVTNMPGACGRTATEALVNATSYYTLALANLGWKKALHDIPGLKEGLNICLGEVTNREVAEEQWLTYTRPETFL